jgi:hypothetical protein
MSEPGEPRYSIGRGGEDEPGLILIIDHQQHIVVAQSGEIGLRFVQELVDLANRPVVTPVQG